MERASAPSPTQRNETMTNEKYNESFNGNDFKGTEQRIALDNAYAMMEAVKKHGAEAVASTMMKLGTTDLGTNPAQASAFVQAMKNIK